MLADGDAAIAVDPSGDGDGVAACRGRVGRRIGGGEMADDEGPGRPTPGPRRRRRRDGADGEYQGGANRPWTDQDGDEEEGRDGEGVPEPAESRRRRRSGGGSRRSAGAGCRDSRSAAAGEERDVERHRNDDQRIAADTVIEDAPAGSARRRRGGGRGFSRRGGRLEERVRRASHLWGRVLRSASGRDLASEEWRASFKDTPGFPKADPQARIGKSGLLRRRRAPRDRLSRLPGCSRRRWCPCPPRRRQWRPSTRDDGFVGIGVADARARHGLGSRRPSEGTRSTLSL